MRKILTSLLVLFCVIATQAQTTYKNPPAEIMALADVKRPPQPLISRNNTYLVLLERPLYKTVEELAEPELKLAGLRINPANFNVTRGTYYTSITLQKIAGKVAIPIKGLPNPLKAQYVQVSPNEKYCSFVQVGKTTLSLWLIDMATGVATEYVQDGLNATLGTPYFWSSQDDFICIKSKGNKQRLETSLEMPLGPATQDATGSKSAARTYQDLLRNKRDETIFNYYATFAYDKIDIATKKRTQLLPEAIYTYCSFSPDQKYILTEQLQEPYSYSLPYSYFPSEFRISDASGQFISVFYKRPLQDKVPISFDAVEAGKREIMWRNDKPATLFWCEAPDGGDPTKEVTYRDELFTADYPFTEVKKLCSIKNRLNDVTFGNNNLLVVKDYWRKNRNTKTYLINPSIAGGSPQVIFDLSSEDLYANPGDFHTTFNEYNRTVLEMGKENTILYLTGEGYSPDGNRPFLDEFNLSTKKTKRVWRADGKSTYENIIRVINAEKALVITSIESPKIYPNLYLRDCKKSTQPTQITFSQNPYLALQNISKQRIYYKRKDGVQLSATLYLPAGYDKSRDGRLPMLMSAYPTEYKDDKAAGQVQESPHQFINIGWPSPLFWVARGYAILEDAQFPIIGKGDAEPNDTYIEQLVADAEAAIDAVDSMGVVDRAKCAVMGHSYGAFMTANLLAHSNLFAAGLARSGAYNRTLTPFGFQAEERSYWEAQDVYLKMSPFNYAHKIKTPILLIHGDADNNPGTFTLQSERLFQAIKGNGGKARLVLLPYESHSYAARENILHMLWEMDTWLDTFVKNKK
jgi:dipeptidyl aminopeptidase/acylaminoacyl peptidase